VYTIHFYKDRNGHAPVAEYIENLGQKTDKSSRIKYKKISEYIQKLSETGLQTGMPAIRHLNGRIWELRPIRDRILFAAWINGSFVLLHHFTKKSQRTPPQEIEQALRNLQTLEEGANSDGK
jgi:phage-related protein